MGPLDICGTRTLERAMKIRQSAAVALMKMDARDKVNQSTRSKATTGDSGDYNDRSCYYGCMSSYV